MSCLGTPNNNLQGPGVPFVQGHVVFGRIQSSALSVLMRTPLTLQTLKISGIGAGSKLASHRHGPLQLLCQLKLLPQDLSLLL